MIPLDAKPNKFDPCVRGLKVLVNLDGLLLTLPFKANIIPHADTVLPAAKRIGAIARPPAQARFRRRGPAIG